MDENPAMVRHRSCSDPLKGSGVRPDCFAQGACNTRSPLWTCTVLMKNPPRLQVCQSSRSSSGFARGTDRSIRLQCTRALAPITYGSGWVTGYLDRAPFWPFPEPLAAGNRGWGRVGHNPGRTANSD